VVMAIRGEKEEERKVDKNLVPLTNSSWLIVIWRWEFFLLRIIVFLMRLDVW
jgi:hypothetical protein